VVNSEDGHENTHSYSYDE